MRVDGILALIAGILGLLGSVTLVFLSAINIEFIEQGIGGIIFSTLAVVAAVMCKKRPKPGAILMFIAAVGGLFTASLFYIVSFVLLIIAGIMSLKKAKLLNEEISA
ncbi:hypothetical protein [Cytobacillus oceanisediminis]|uniref:hypothetical protein n=1 Tax=Cytobacillus oceanisediminis TaxID=665099 RepID=UPI0037362C0B